MGWNQPCAKCGRTQWKDGDKWKVLEVCPCSCGVPLCRSCFYKCKCPQSQK